MTGQVAFFLCGCTPRSIVQQLTRISDSLGLQMGNTTLSAYIVDNYPSHANEVITFYTVWINVGQSGLLWTNLADALQMSAFIIPWFIFPWIESSGKAISQAPKHQAGAAIITATSLFPRSCSAPLLGLASTSRSSAVTLTSTSTDESQATPSHSLHKPLSAPSDSSRRIFYS
jgi:hypothetical protein